MTSLMSVGAKPHALLSSNPLAPGRPDCPGGRLSRSGSSFAAEDFYAASSRDFSCNSSSAEGCPELAYQSRSIRYMRTNSSLQRFHFG